MAVKGYTKVKTEEEMVIRNYLKSGMHFSEIEKLTGRKHPTIRRIRDKMLSEEGTASNNVVELPTEEVEKTPESMDTVRDHRDDPRWASNISIRMVAKIVGNKTGYEYRADFDKKLLTITTTEGIQLALGFDVIEKFLDEMIDVSVEVGDLKRKFA